jgi:hypothetical protein
MHLTENKTRVTDFNIAQSTTRLSLLTKHRTMALRHITHRQPGCPGSLRRGPVALRPHLSMGLPFRSRSLSLLRYQDLNSS